MDSGIRERLFALRDEKYREFQCGLMPTVDRNLVIGVRTPALRKLACEIGRSGTAGDFLGRLPHMYYEENNLHALLIGQIKDADSCISATERFLPYVDNWATCDMMTPAAFRKNLAALEKKALSWLESEHAYTVRFGIKMLMNFFLDEKFSPVYPEAVASLRSDEYYVKMMQAWYFATALAKRFEEILPFISDGRLDRWTHNKAVQKGIESRRLSPEQKEILRSFRRK